MEHKLFVLCDAEEDYALHMADFLRRKMEASWDIMTYTRPEQLKKLEAIDILLVAEAVYNELPKELAAEMTIVLNESGMLTYSAFPNIDKYQSAERVYQEILAHYMEHAGELFPRVQGGGSGRLIGMYSPVHRCLQTTFALTYGQIMAQKHKVLFLSFAYYGDFEGNEENKGKDLSALLYLQQTKPKDLGLHIQTLVQRVGGLDCITPMINGDNLLYITAKEWQELLVAIANSGEYEYIILDLSESVQGLFEILQMCERIYTMVLEDRRAQEKLRRYEYLLSLQECKEVQKRTIQCKLAKFYKHPLELEQYTKGELANYVREMIERYGE